MSSTRIYIIAPYIGNIRITNSNRFIFLASLLYSSGFEVILVTSNFCHSSKTYFSNKDFDHYPFKVTLIPVLPYSLNVSILRLISNISFGFNLFFRLLTNISLKRTIYYVAYPFFEASFPVLFFRKPSDKLIIDLQDLWPESFSLIKTDNFFSIITTFVINIYIYFVRIIFSSADHLVSVSNQFITHAIIKYKYPKQNSSTVLYIGSYAENFDFNLEDIKERCSKFNSNRFTIGYIGNLSHSYDLSTVLKFISHYNFKFNSDVSLLIIGDGENANSLKKLASMLSLNVTISGWLPYEIALQRLSKCHIAVNPITSQSFASIINKHSDYSYLGLPILNSQKSTEYIDMLNKYNCGRNYSPNSYESFNIILRDLILDPNYLLNASIMSRKMWIDNFDRSRTYPKAIQEIF